jgi:hypothetical protein
MEESNLVIEGQVRDMKPVRQADGGRLIAIARNDDKLQILRPLRAKMSSRTSAASAGGYPPKAGASRSGSGRR